MTWIERVEENLCPLSVSSNVAEALEEWFYTGDAFDLEKPVETCQLCNHPDIRYQFLIRNEHTEHELLIGSEFITKFGIAAVDKWGSRLDEEATHRQVRSDRNKLISDAKKRAVANVLVALAGQDDEFDIESFITYVRDRGAFTPKQLSLLIWRLDKYNIEYNKADFKLTARRDREKRQLLQMEDWRVKKLWPCMSSSQRQAYIDKNGDPF